MFSSSADGVTGSDTGSRFIRHRRPGAARCSWPLQLSWTLPDVWLGLRQRARAALEGRDRAPRTGLFLSCPREFPGGVQDCERALAGRAGRGWPWAMPWAPAPEGSCRDMFLCTWLPPPHPPTHPPVTNSQEASWPGAPALTRCSRGLSAWMVLGALRLVPFTPRAHVACGTAGACSGPPSAASCSHAASPGLWTLRGSAAAGRSPLSHCCFLLLHMPKNSSRALAATPSVQSCGGGGAARSSQVSRAERQREGSAKSCEDRGMQLGAELGTGSTGQGEPCLVGVVLEEALRGARSASSSVSPRGPGRFLGD